jgi:starch phosphorylase
MHMLLPRELPPGLAVLAELALDLRWTWSHGADALFRSLDAESWDATRNPWFILQNVSRRRLDELAADATFRAELDRLAAARSEYLASPSWCHTEVPALRGRHVAYFCMEYGLSEAIPLYAGGLGVLAGDYLKTASDLGIPVVAVGILFQEGYFRQSIDMDGRQREAYPYNDASSLPVQPVMGREGGWLRVALDLPGRAVWLRVWRANVGRVPLYLLDANDPRNSPNDRAITSRLYGGGHETRLLQEIVLGIGGWRALGALGIDAHVAHLNEGHAALVVVERTRELMARAKLDFRAALWATRAGTVFTTHTPVAAGFDAFAPELVGKYFPAYGRYLHELGLSLDELLALGRVDRGDARAPFNMAYLAMRGAAYVNGVSRVHGEVSRAIFAGLFPRWPAREVPIDHVTNGVHVPSWDSCAADALWTNACGKTRWLGSVDALPAAMGAVTDDAMWTTRAEDRAALVHHARERLALHLAQRGADPSVVADAANVLDPNVLTLGFARRFAEYKRPTLLLRDADRFARLLLDAERPVQIVVAGKAHPDDEQAKQMIAEWIRFTNRPALRHRAVFLEDYDLTLAAYMVQGVDVWLNTPRRPWEACGTSGMKVLVNGGLNLSERDGWWAEAYSPDVGWALGDGSEPTPDGGESDALYALLEREIVPEFYDREDGIPRRWVKRIRASVATLAPRFSCNRMAREYVERAYLPALAAFDARIEDGGRVARDLSAWERELAAKWGQIHFGTSNASSEDGKLRYSVDVYLGDVAPEAVDVELFAEPVGNEAAVRARMDRGAALLGAAHGYAFTAQVPTTRAASDFTARVVPRHAHARAPGELQLIAWQR